MTFEVSSARGGRVRVAAARWFDARAVGTRLLGAEVEELTVQTLEDGVRADVEVRWVSVDGLDEIELRQRVAGGSFGPWTRVGQFVFQPPPGAP